MPRFTFDIYAAATVKIIAPSEAAARKMLQNDDYCQEMFPIGGDIELTTVGGLPLPLHLQSLSHRKVWCVPFAEIDGEIVSGQIRPDDGPIAELEALRDDEYCAEEDCDQLIADQDAGQDGYCGTCADARNADQAPL